MDKFKTNRASRSFLQNLINFLDKKDIAYTLDNEEETIAFDLTELSANNQEKVKNNLVSVEVQSEVNYLTPKQEQIAQKLKPLVKQIMNESNNEITDSFKLSLLKMDIDKLKSDMDHYTSEILNVQKQEKKISKEYIIKLIKYLEKTTVEFKKQYINP